MQISEHYLGYPKETLIVVTNNHQAKLLKAHDREIEEFEVLAADEREADERASGTANAAPPETDEERQHDRKELYHQLSDRLLELVHEGTEHIVLCAPEALKNQITDAMHTDVMKCVDEVVPKNLASLELDQIVRILQEKRAA